MRAVILRAVIRERRVLPGLRSASALERVGSFYFVIGDDTPDLYRMDTELNLISATRLFDPQAAAESRLPKESKPDLESLCCVEWQNRRELLCFGSGSKSPARDVCYRVDVTDPASPQNVRAVSLTALYDSLRANPAIVGTKQLNVEGTAATRNSILLFQRGNISGLNAQIEFDLFAFMQFLDEPISSPPQARVVTYDLPQIKGRRAGFSAAITFHDSILFAASVEDTDNEIDDGATLGSFIGKISGAELDWICAVESDPDAVPAKIEGIAIESDAADLVLVAVTDNDQGESEMLRIVVQ